LVRDLPPFNISLKFEGHRVWLTVGGMLDEETEVAYRIAADYHLTKDSMLYGIITSAEINLTPNSAEDWKEGAAFAQELFDQPFAIRYRLDEGVLTVKDFKMGPIAGDAESSKELKAAILGCYRPASPESGGR
jgi:hypothetical protein